VPVNRPNRVRQAATSVAAMARGGSRLRRPPRQASTRAAIDRAEPGDEILLTDHNYGATLKVAQFVARERGTCAP
jgi:hypothetical protein